MIREKIALGDIGPIRWRRDGYGLQVLRLSAGGFCPGDGPGGETVPDRNRIQRGYVKVWHRPSPTVEARVIDRALTVKVARRRIAQHKAGWGA